MFEHSFVVKYDEIALAPKRPCKAARLVRAINFIYYMHVKNIFSPHLMNPKMMRMMKVLWFCADNNCSYAEATEENFSSTRYNYFYL